MKIKPNYKLDLQLFADDPNSEENNNPQDNEELDPTKQLVDTIKDLQENTVPKDKYEALEKQNKELIKSFLNGGRLPQEEKPDIKKMREDLFKGEKNNLEFAKGALALRKAIMDEGGVDPFVPVGEKIVPSDDDFKAAQKVADVFQECIDQSNGDSGVFTNLLQSKTIDVMPMLSASRKKIKA